MERFRVDRDEANEEVAEAGVISRRQLLGIGATLGGAGILGLESYKPEPARADREVPRESLDLPELLRFLTEVVNNANADWAEAENFRFSPELGPPVEPHVRMERREVTEFTELIREGKWNMPGAERTSQGMRLTPTGLAIVDKRNGNRYVPNEPLNVYGSYLEVDGDFSITARLNGDPAAAVQLYGKPPVRFDDFNLYTSRLEVTTDNNILRARVWDGSSQTPTTTEFALDTGVTENRQIEVRRVGDTLQLLVNGQPCGELPNGELFDTGQVWMGLNSEGEEPTTVSKLLAKPLNGDQMSVVDSTTLTITQPSPPGLQSLLAKDSDFRFGSAVSLNQLMFDPQYQQLILGGNLGRFTTENEGKPQDIQPTEGVFTFERLGALLEIARKNKLKVRVHAGWYDKALPQWIRDLPVETEEQKARFREVYETHLTTLANFLKRYEDVIDIVDVINEVLIPGPNLLTDPLSRVNDQSQAYKAYGGDEHIDVAFHIMHDALPNAKLALNEGGLGHWWDVIGWNAGAVDLVRRLKQRDAPVHIIGFQGHVQEQIPFDPAQLGLPPEILELLPPIPPDFIKSEHLKARMAEYEQHGVEVQVTELDVPGRSGNATDMQLQAWQYAEVTRPSLETKSCKAVTVWGMNDEYGSRISGDLTRAKDLIYDLLYRLKPAGAAMNKLARGIKRYIKR